MYDAGGRFHHVPLLPDVYDTANTKGYPIWLDVLAVRFHYIFTSYKAKHVFTTIMWAWYLYPNFQRISWVLDCPAATFVCGYHPECWTTAEVRTYIISNPLQWRHNVCDGVSNQGQQPGKYFHLMTLVSKYRLLFEDSLIPKYRLTGDWKSPNNS